MTSRNRQKTTASIELTRRVLTDSREIEHYSVKTWDRKTADKYVDAIAATLDRLRERPEILRLETDVAPDLFFQAKRT
jgi:plasmid stabilization system protein ParE